MPPAGAKTVPAPFVAQVVGLLPIPVEAVHTPDPVPLGEYAPVFAPPPNAKKLLPVNKRQFVLGENEAGVVAAVQDTPEFDEY